MAAKTSYRAFAALAVFAVTFAVLAGAAALAEDSEASYSSGKTITLPADGSEHYFPWSSAFGASYYDEWGAGYGNMTAYKSTTFNNANYVSGISWSSDPTSSGIYLTAKTTVSAGTYYLNITCLDEGGVDEVVDAYCTLKVTSASSTTKVTSISISGSSTVVVDKTITLTASVSPSNATNKSVTWSSSDDSVATVNSSGVVTGVKAGSATITATAQDGSGVSGSKSIKVSSSSVLVTSMTISGESKVKVGESSTYTVNVYPTTATDKSVTWSISNNGSIADIDPDTGELTANSPGTILIKATANDGSKKTATKSISLYEEFTLIVELENGRDPITYTATSTYGYANISIGTTPTKSGYTFGGWADSPGATEKDYEGSIVKVSDDDGYSKTVYAVWTETQYTHTATLKYDANGGTDAPTADKYSYTDTISGDTGTYQFTITQDEPSYGSNVFAGWSTSKTTSATSSSLKRGGDTIDVPYGDSPVTLYAIWQMVYTYTAKVTYTSSGGTGIPADQSDDKQIASSTPSGSKTFTVGAFPTWTGHTCKYWISSYDGQYYSPGQTIIVPYGTTVTLTAKWDDDTYAVSFVNDNNTVWSGEVAYNSTVSAPSTPSKTGYTFNGWYTSSGVEWTSSYKVTASVTFVASWTINTYKITFISQGTTVATKTAEYGGTVSAPADPVYSGHTFTGWFNGTSKWTADTTFTSNVTYTAKWDTETYTVTFNSAGGTSYDPQYVEYGECAYDPGDPERRGYTFDGWYNGSKKFAFTTAITGDTTLTAHWTVKKYTVTFDSDGGSDVEAQQVSYNGYVDRPANPTKTGYAFDGWYNGSVLFDFDTQITSSITLTAKWSVRDYTVSYYLGGAPLTISSVTASYGQILTKPSDPVWSGHQFEGWYVDNVLWDWSKGVTGDMTLVARWSNVYVFTLTYDANGGTGTIQGSTHSGTESSWTFTVTSSTPVRDGYDFLGWSESSTATEAAYTAGQSIVMMNDYDIKLYAVWKVKTFTVTFDSAQGSSVPSQTVEYGGKATAPSEPTRAGYTFMGWKVQNAGDYDFNTPVTSNLTLVAQWIVYVPTWTVTYNAASGTSGVPSSRVEQGGSIVLTTASRTGYVFDGWYNEATNTLIGIAGDTYTPGDNITLTAHWTVIKWLVSFNLNGGDGVISAQYVEHGKAATRPANPTMGGCTFDHWEYGGVEYDFSTPVTHDITLVASWTDGSAGSDHGAGYYVLLVVVFAIIAGVIVYVVRHII